MGGVKPPRVLEGAALERGDKQGHVSRRVPGRLSRARRLSPWQRAAVCALPCTRQGCRAGCVPTR